MKDGTETLQRVLTLKGQAFGRHPAAIPARYRAGATKQETPINGRCYGLYVPVSIKQQGKQGSTGKSSRESYVIESAELGLVATE